MEQVTEIPTILSGRAFQDMSWKDGLVVSNHRDRPCISTPPQPKDVEYDLENGWIVKADGTERLLWVPPECRPHAGSSYAIRGQTFVSGSDSGQVFWISFYLGGVLSR
ncbi:uncharacterized protein LDX57_001429 [Aspergillus melleus]|uniref:uncharacterized protein n=1 Tax=Aspergillus melleus TaxID=138277 RepID=UPI001E8E293F|nr:uncharacterized protein LDX57_001429 [Aspergillus melleus]KAH8423672.1 hypothetical protein LDX57_001429 [Aspergillus melleus]